jgi:hypothetical protein
MDYHRWWAGVVITSVIHKIKKPEAEAMEMAAFTSRAASYDKEKGELSFTVNEAKEGTLRLVHDDKRAYVIEGTDRTITTSMLAIEEFDTEKEILDRIETLNLEYDPPA